MNKKDPRINAYIKKSAAFAQPILKHLRVLVQKAVPDTQETIKWGFPHFEYAGGILCSMAAFQQHCAFGFWNAKKMQDPHGLLAGIGKTAMGNFGRITSLKDLPRDTVLIAYIKEAARLNEHGVKASTGKPQKAAKRMRAPKYFLDALRKNKKAFATYESFSTTNKNDYIEWLTEAKTDATRAKRLATAITWLAQGKIRNWKYVK